MSVQHVVAFQVWDKAGKRLRTVERRGKMFEVDGVYVKLFPIRVMAEAIDRTTRTLGNWERQGLFPKPMFKVPGTNCLRWYSEAQILRLNQIWLEFRDQGKGMHFDRDAFLSRIREVFYKADLERIKELDDNVQS